MVEEHLNNGYRKPTGISGKHLSMHAVPGTTARNSLKALVKEFPLISGDEKILVLGAAGQVGGYLNPVFKHFYPNNIIFTDKARDEDHRKQLAASGIQELDALNHDAIKKTIVENNVKVVLNLAALLSGAAEKMPELAKQLNHDMPIALIDIAKETGVRRIFTPSSIAAVNIDDVNKYAPVVGVKQEPSGEYGKNKVGIEKAYLKATQEGGVIAQSLRLAGVLTTRIPPSDGTTEELDKLIVAMAEYKVLNDLGRKKDCKYSDGSCHYPEIPIEHTFPMIDGNTVGYEIFRYMHADPAQIKDKASLYYLGEYSASLKDVHRLLEDQVPGFVLVENYSKFNKKKVAFGYEWPRRIDNQTSINDWGFQPRYDAESSIMSKFKKCVEEFKEIHLGIKKGGGEVSVKL